MGTDTSDTVPVKRGRGRPPGSLNKATLEVRELCAELVTSEKYRASFRERFENGELPPAVETMVWAYAFGRPTENIKIKAPMMLPPMQILLHPDGIEGADDE
jgi:hypothetical protein